MKEAATEILNRIAEAVPVKWDRLVEDGPTLSVYGWIERPCPGCDLYYRGQDGAINCAECIVAGSGKPPDRRADFVLVRFEGYSDAGGSFVTYFTSSSEHSEAIGVAIWGHLGEGVHNECQRVEDVLPGIEAAIKL